MSLSAYQQAQQNSEHPKQTEYRLFGQVTGALIKARDNARKDAAFFDALDWNRRLWSVMATDCGMEGNGLPKETRAGIISLSIFVSKYTSQVSRGQESIDTLIDINKTIMEGLKQIPGQAPAAEAKVPVSYPSSQTQDEQPRSSGMRSLSV